MMYASMNDDAPDSPVSFPAVTFCVITSTSRDAFIPTNTSMPARRSRSCRSVVCSSRLQLPHVRHAADVHAVVGNPPAIHRLVGQHQDAIEPSTPSELHAGEPDERVAHRLPPGPTAGTRTTE